MRGKPKPKSPHPTTPKDRESPEAKHHWRKRWEQIDPMLIMASLAPKEEKKHLLARIGVTQELGPQVLENRLSYLGARLPSIREGYAAVERWHQRLQALAVLYRRKAKLQRAIALKNVKLLSQVDEYEDRRLSVNEAAKFCGGFSGATV